MTSKRGRGTDARKSVGSVLVLLHQAHSTTGRVGRLLRLLGYALDIRYPLAGDDLPSSLDKYAGVIVFGGPMSANDSDAQLRREINWLETPLRQKKPFLGLCLGAQMMARQMGARIYRPASQRAEIGYRRIRPTAAADRICKARFPEVVYHWHSEGFDIPTGAFSLAGGDEDFPNQAYIYSKNVVGLQFHPEVTYHMMCRWTTRGAARLGHSGVASREEHLAGWLQHDGGVDSWISAFLCAWARDELRWRDPTLEMAPYPIAAE